MVAIDSVPGGTRAVAQTEEEEDVVMGGTLELPSSPGEILRRRRQRYEAQQAAHADLFRLQRERRLRRCRDKWRRIARSNSGWNNNGGSPSSKSSTASNGKNFNIAGRGSSVLFQSLGNE